MKGVFCYRNLNRKGIVWSVKSNKTGRVLKRSTYVLLKDVTLKVSKAGRARVLKQKRKNVHAGAVGTLVSKKGQDDFMNYNAASVPRSITYNPYKMEQFTEVNTGNPIYKAKYVLLSSLGAYAWK